METPLNRLLIVGGFCEMEYDLLKEYVDQKFSVEEISKLSGKSNGSVKYWLRKHNMKIIMGESERMRRAKTLSETMKKYWANKSPEEKSDIATKRQATRTSEQRSEWARKMNTLQTPERRRLAAIKRRKVGTSRIPKTPEQRSKIVRNIIKFQCTVTGHISTAGALANYQRARGIDTSLRVKLFNYNRNDA
jgi:hypothetical protein